MKIWPLISDGPVFAIPGIVRAMESANTMGPTLLARAPRHTMIVPGERAESTQTTKMGVVS